MRSWRANRVRAATGGGDAAGLARSAVGRSAVRAGERPAARAGIRHARRRRSNARCDCSRRTRSHGWCSARFDLVTGEPQAAVKELQAAIYLDPQLISAEAVAAGRARSDRNPQRLHPGVAGRQRQKRAAPKRARGSSASARRSSSGARRATRPRGADVDRLEAEVAEQRGERLAAVVAQVIPARIEVLGEGTPGERHARERERAVARACSPAALPPERSTRRTSDSQAAVSATCSITSPAQTTSKPASGSSQLLRRRRVADRARGCSARARRSGSSATSMPTTCAPARDELSREAPSPQPTSSTRCPAADVRPAGSDGAARSLPARAPAEIPARALRGTRAMASDRTG